MQHGHGSANGSHRTVIKIIITNRQTTVTEFANHSLSSFPACQLTGAHGAARLARTGSTRSRGGARGGTPGFSCSSGGTCRYDLRTSRDGSSPASPSPVGGAFDGSARCRAAADAAQGLVAAQQVAPPAPPATAQQAAATNYFHPIIYLVDFFWGFCIECVLLFYGTVNSIVSSSAYMIELK